MSNKSKCKKNLIKFRRTIIIHWTDVIMRRRGLEHIIATEKFNSGEDKEKNKN